jgi:hypothetical protein
MPAHSLHVLSRNCCAAVDSRRDNLRKTGASKAGMSLEEQVTPAVKAALTPASLAGA